MLMHTITLPDKRPVQIHFDGDYFKDDNNNLFLGRHSETRMWYVYTRHGYEEKTMVVARNKSIIRAATIHDHYHFDAAWNEYLDMVTEATTNGLW